MAADARDPDGDARGRAPARGLRLRRADARRRAGPRADDQPGGLVHRRAAAAPPPPPPPPPPPEPERHFAIGVDVMVGSGAFPASPAVSGCGFAAGAAALSAECAASLWLSRSTASPAGPGRGRHVRPRRCSVAGCARARHDERVSPGVCAGASVVRVHGRGYGVGYPADTSAWWTAAFAEASLRVRVSPLNAVRLRHRAWSRWAARLSSCRAWVTFSEPATIWLRGTLGWELHF